MTALVPETGRDERVCLGVLENKGDGGSAERPAEVEAKAGGGAGVTTLPEALMVLAASYARCRFFTSGL